MKTAQTSITDEAKSIQEFLKGFGLNFTFVDISETLGKAPHELNILNLNDEEEDREELSNGTVIRVPRSALELYWGFGFCGHYDEDPFFEYYDGCRCAYLHHAGCAISLELDEFITGLLTCEKRLLKIERIYDPEGFELWGK